jgi:hypothetical protein
MGSYNHPVVMDLRLFRDNWLLKRTWGIKFTSWYYKTSPSAAILIENNVYLKKYFFFCFIKPLHFLTKRLK